MTVETFVILQKISIFNKCCLFNSIFINESWENNNSFNKTLTLSSSLNLKCKKLNMKISIVISISVHPYFFLSISFWWSIHDLFIHTVLFVSLFFQEKPLSRSLQRGEDAQFDQVSMFVSFHYLIIINLCRISLSYPLCFSVLAFSLSHHSFLISAELLTAVLEQNALFSKMQSKWDIILQWIQSVPLGLSLCVRKNEPVRMCSVCRKSQQYVSVCLYTLEWTEFCCVCVCVCVCAGRCQEQNRCVIRSSRSALAARNVCACVWEYISSGCWSVSAKCHEARESGHTTLLYIILSHTHTHSPDAGCKYSRL